MGVNVVRSVARLSRGIYSQLVLSLSSEGHGVKEKEYMMKGGCKRSSLCG